MSFKGIAQIWKNKMKIRSWTVCLIFLFGHFFAFAQKNLPEILWAEQSFDQLNGMDEKHVYQVFQDQRGYLWLITDASLIFFDGVKFFRVADHRLLETFQDISIRSQDSAGRIWVRYNSGAEQRFKVFDGYDRKLLDVSTLIPDDLSVEEVRDVTVDEGGDFYLLTEGGTVWMHSSESIDWRRFESCIGSEFNFAFSSNDANEVWLISDPVPEESLRVLAYWSSGKLNFFKVKELIHIARMGDGKLLYLQKDSLGTIDYKGIIENQPLSLLFPGYDPEIEDIRSFNSSFGYDQNTGDIFLLHDDKHILELANLKKELPYTSNNLPFLQSIFSGISDGTNGIWLGSLEGLKHMEYRVNSFDRILWKDPGKDRFYHQYSVRGIAGCSNGQVFFSADSHLWIHDPHSGFTEQLLYTNNGTSDVIWDAMNQRIWTLGEQLIAYDPLKKTFDKYETPEVFDNGYTFGIYSLGDSLLLTSTNGMQIFRIADEAFVPFTGYGEYQGLKTAEVYGFFELNSSELFIYSNNGIYRWEKNGKITGHYSDSGEGKFHIPAVSIRHIYRDNEGIIWLATAEGLIRWEFKDDGTNQFTVIEELSRKNLYGVFEDDHGFLWLSSNNGIIQYHKASGKTRSFIAKFGITNNEFNRLSHERDEYGNLYFGSLNGITRFHPDDFVYDPENLETQQVDLISLSVFDRKKKVLNDETSSYYSGNRIRIDPSKINFSADFAINAFDVGERVRYAYRLKNKGDNEWLQLESPTLQIAALPYGKYDIEIRVSDGQMEFADSYLSIPVMVMPPLYLRPWFVLMNSFVFLGLLGWGVLRELRRKEKQNLILKDLVEKSTTEIIADKKLIEAQAAELRRQNLEKDRFFANISHEFRTPISLILGPANLLEEKFKSSTKEYALLQTIKNNAGGLLKLINDILMLSKLDYSKVQPQISIIDLNEIIDEVCNEFDSLFERKEVVFKKDLSFRQSVWVNADPQFLKIVLQNLLSNALKFTPPYKEVALGYEVAGNNLTLWVKDQGRGIHPDDLGHIFDRYFQSSLEEYRIEGGTGIGLSLVQDLVKSLGGRIEVNSKLGVGTEFSIEFTEFIVGGLGKKKKKQEPDIEASSDLRLLIPEKLLSEIEGRHLLLVDDNADFFDYIRQILGVVFDMKYARNGKEALALLNGGLRPIIILTDLMMPEMDGLQLIASIKAAPEWRNIPVLALTARADDQCRIDAFTMGVNDYLLKPFDSRQLIVSIANLIERRAVLLDNKEKGETNSTYKEISDWLLQVKELIEGGIESTDFSVDELARLMLMSRSSFYNKIKMVTGLTPNQLIMEIRLQKARALLIDNPGLTNKQVMRMVGLKHEPHFITSFTRRFGYTPGQMKN